MRPGYGLGVEGLRNPMNRLAVTRGLRITIRCITFMCAGPSGRAV